MPHTHTLHRAHTLLSHAINVCPRPAQLRKSLINLRTPLVYLSELTHLDPSAWQSTLQELISFADDVAALLRSYQPNDPEFAKRITELEANSINHELDLDARGFLTAFFPSHLHASRLNALANIPHVHPNRIPLILNSLPHLLAFIFYLTSITPAPDAVSNALSVIAKQPSNPPYSLTTSPDQPPLPTNTTATPPDFPSYHQICTRSHQFIVKHSDPQSPHAAVAKPLISFIRTLADPGLLSPKHVRLDFPSNHFALPFQLSHSQSATIYKAALNLVDVAQPSRNIFMSAVALKAFPTPSLPHNNSRSRFQYYALLLRSLPHPCIPVFYGYSWPSSTSNSSQPPPRALLATELMTCSLQHARLNPILRPYTTRLAILRDLAEAIAFVHRAKQCHARINPHNLLLRISDNILYARAKLDITSLAARAFSPNPIHNTPFRLLLYCAPELLANPKSPPFLTADVWSFAMLACFLLLTSNKFIQSLSDHSLAILIADPEAAELTARKWCNSLPYPSLRPILSKCLLADPLSRLDSQTLSRSINSLYIDATKHAQRAVQAQKQEDEIIDANIEDELLDSGDQTADPPAKPTTPATNPNNNNNNNNNNNTTTTTAPNRTNPPVSFYNSSYKSTSPSPFQPTKRRRKQQPVVSDPYMPPLPQSSPSNTHTESIHPKPSVKPEPKPARQQPAAVHSQAAPDSANSAPPTSKPQPTLQPSPVVTVDPVDVHPSQPAAVPQQEVIEVPSPDADDIFAAPPRSPVLHADDDFQQESSQDSDDSSNASSSDEHDYSAIMNQDAKADTDAIMQDISVPQNARDIHSLALSLEHGQGVDKDISRAIQLYRLASTKGCEEATVNLGRCFEKGLGVNKCWKTAQHLYERVARQDFIPGILALGKLLEEKCVSKKRYVGETDATRRALRCYERAANSGNAEGMRCVADCLLVGFGTGQDMERAIVLLKAAWDRGNLRAGVQLGDHYRSEDFKASPEFKEEACSTIYRQAAEKGDTEGQERFGECLFYGTGVERDYKKAFGHFTIAANKGNVEALKFLGECYEDSKGVEQDFVKAMECFKKGAEAGSACSKASLASCYERGAGVEPNMEKAIRLYREAAKQNDWLALNNLGVLYEAGTHVRQDYHKARKYYQAAVDQSFTDAMCNLGDLYRNGYGGRKDMTKAVALYRRAVEQDGHVGAMCELGTCYYIGKGVKRDYATAVKLYTEASSGESEALRLLGKAYYDGHGVARDASEAVKLFKQAIEEGNTEANLNLGICYSQGCGAKKCLETAHSLYVKAAEGGSKEAMLFAGNMYFNGKGVKKNYDEAKKLFVEGEGVPLPPEAV